MKTSLGILTLSCLVACGTNSGGQSDAGPINHVDAGVDAGWTKHTIEKDTFCSCPGQTAAHFTSAESGSAAVEWKKTFLPITLEANDHLNLLFDFSGPATWEVSLLDGDGNPAFSTSGTPFPDATTWHCIFVDYSLRDSNYSITIDDTGAGAATNATLPTTVSGVHVKYSGSNKSAAWLDSVVITRLSGSSTELLYEESFDDPALGPAGAVSGQTTIATPPPSVLAPAGFCR